MRLLKGHADVSLKTVSFSHEEEKHARVIRLRIQEKIQVLDLELGQTFLCEIVSVSPLKGKIISLGENSRELPFKLTLFIPLLKKDNFEFCLQKGTELGVSEFVPFISSRVIKRLTPEEFEQRRERFEKIIMEAVEQSNRSSLPLLKGLVGIKDLPSLKTDISYLAYEEEALKGEKTPLDQIKTGAGVSACFGPEGGFSSEEASYLQKGGFRLVSLGKRILRAETACVFLLSVLSYLGE